MVRVADVARSIPATGDFRLAHDDASDLGLSKRMLTVIVSLNDNRSGLQLLGFAPMWYTRTGDAVVFHGHVQHRTVLPADESPGSHGRDNGACTGAQLACAPVKVAMFFDFTAERKRKKR